MTIRQGVSAALACAPLLLAAAAYGQDATQQSTQHPGRSVVMSKCFQCHTDAMFRDQRQDRGRHDDISEPVEMPERAIGVLRDNRRGEYRPEPAGELLQ